jgi:hypothetical protein
MPIIAKRKEFFQVPEGLYQGVCVDVVDLGLQQTPWGAKPKIQIRWILDQEDEQNRSLMVTQLYTLSLDEKSTLRKHLEAWRGRKFTVQELDGFDVETLIGANCQIQIVHVLTQKGQTFASVQAVVPIGKTTLKMRVPSSYIRMKDRDPAAPVATAPADEEVPF